MPVTSSQSSSGPAEVMVEESSPWHRASTLFKFTLALLGGATLVFFGNARHLAHHAPSRLLESAPPTGFDFAALDAKLAALHTAAAMETAAANAVGAPGVTTAAAPNATSAITTTATFAATAAAATTATSAPTTTTTTSTATTPSSNVAKTASCLKLVVSYFVSWSPETLKRTRAFMPMNNVGPGGTLPCGLSMFFALYDHDAGGKRNRIPDPIPDDVIVLAGKENMNSGKSLDYFSHLMSGKDTRFRDISFMAKLDLDSQICPKTLEERLIAGLRNKEEYFGWAHNHYTCGTYAHCPPKDSRWRYMSGAFYGVTTEVARAVVANPATRGMQSGYEDLQFGKMVFNAKPNVKLSPALNCMYERRPGIIAPCPPKMACPVRHRQKVKSVAMKGTLCAQEEKEKQGAPVDHEGMYNCVR